MVCSRILGTNVECRADRGGCLMSKFICAVVGFVAGVIIYRCAMAGDFTELANAMFYGALGSMLRAALRHAD